MHAIYVSLAKLLHFHYFFFVKLIFNGALKAISWTSDDLFFLIDPTEIDLRKNPVNFVGNQPFEILKILKSW
ncbi:MAG: hypothetical protein OHK0019_30800 [Saprospiraceae bacterium]